MKSSILVTLLMIIACLIVFWGLNKGFDITDGGCSVLRYQTIQPSEPCDYWYDHIFVKAIVPESLRSIMALRLLGFSINIAIALLFSMAIARYYRLLYGKYPSYAITCLCGLSGFINSYPGMPPDLSYNSLNQALLLGGTATFLLAQSAKLKRKQLLYLITGLIAGLTIAVKLPSALGFIIVTIVVIRWIEPLPNRMLLVFIGGVAVASVLLNCFVSPNFINIYSRAIQDVLHSNSIHNVHLFGRRFLDLAGTILFSSVYGCFLGASLWVYRHARDPLKKNGALLSLLFLTVSFLVYQSINSWFGSIIKSHFYVIWIFSLLIYEILSSRNDYKEHKGVGTATWMSKEQAPVLILLFSIPYIGAVVSAVDWDFISKYYFITYTGLLMILSHSWGRKKQALLLIAIMIYTIVVNLYVYVQHPFGHGPLYRQTIEYQGIFIDAERAKFFRDVKMIFLKNQIDPQDGIIVAYSSPGLAYILGGYEPGGILWKEKQQSNYFDNLKRLKLTTKPAIISLTHELSDDFIEQFNQSTDTDFWNQYKLAGSCCSIDGFNTARVYCPHLE